MNNVEQAKHTSAPWHAPAPDADGWMWPAVYDEKNQLVADCHNSLHSITDEEKANARLIAAAPELLEALVLMLDFQGSHEEMVANNIKARAAIAKATGAQP